MYLCSNEQQNIDINFQFLSDEKKKIKTVIQKQNNEPIKKIIAFVKTFRSFENSFENCFENCLI